MRVDTEIDACASMKDQRNVLVAEFKQRNPRIVSRHKWLKMKQTTEESFTDFLSREKANRRPADVDQMNTEVLVAHVQMLGCTNEELLKKLLEIKEENLNLNEDSIKEVATRLEMVNVTKLGLKKDGGKEGGKIRPVKRKEVICYRYQKQVTYPRSVS